MEPQARFCFPKLVSIGRYQAGAVRGAITKDRCAVVSRWPTFQNFGQSEPYASLNALPNAIFRQDQQRGVAVASPRLRVKELTVRGVSGEDVPVVAQTARRHGAAICLAERRSSVPVREGGNVLRLIGDGGVVNMNRASDEAVVTVAPNRVMTIFSGTGP